MTLRDAIAKIGIFFCMNITKNIGSFVKRVGQIVTAKRFYGSVLNVLDRDNLKLDTGDFLNVEDLSLYTSRALDKRAEKVSEIKFILKNKNGEVIEKNDLLDILNYPNRLFTRSQFYKLYQKYMDLTGYAYFWLEPSGRIFEKGKIEQLHLLRPDWVETVWDENEPNKPREYIYKQPSSDEIHYPAEQIVRIVNPDPKNQLKGQSLLQAGLRAIDTENQISEYHRRVIRNGGKVEGMLVFKTQRLTKQQLEEQEDIYNEKIAGARKSGRPLFLGGDIEYKKLGLSPDELSFLETKKTTLDDIVILTGVPKTILASMDDIKFDNADASIRIFLRETIKPLLQLLADSFDNVFPDDLILSFEDPTPENREQILKETDTLVKGSVMTINEGRERQGLDPIEGGDTILVPFNMVPLDKIDRSEPPAQPPSETPQADEGQKTAHPLKDPFIRRRYWKVWNLRVEKREERFKKDIERYFHEQRDRLIEKVKPLQMGITKGLLDDSFDKTIEVALAKETFLPLLQQILEEAGIDAKDFIGSEYDFLITSEIRSWLEGKADIFADSITETTFNKLQREFEISFDQGESRQDLVKRIETTYGDISKSRAATIARTEVLGVSQKGTFEGYKQANSPIKIWVSVLDSATRDSHISLDGEERPMDVPFSNGLMYPGEAGGPPSEVINCRCTI